MFEEVVLIILQTQKSGGQHSFNLKQCIFGYPDLLVFSLQEFRVDELHYFIEKLVARGERDVQGQRVVVLLDGHDTRVLDDQVCSMVALANVVRAEALRVVHLVEQLVVADPLVGICHLHAVTAVQFRGEFTATVALVLVHLVHGLEQLDELFVHRGEGHALLLQRQAVEPLLDHGDF